MAWEDSAAAVRLWCLQRLNTDLLPSRTHHLHVFARKEPQRSEILDWLFLPGHGAALDILKV